MQSNLVLDRFFSFWTHEAEYSLVGDLGDDQLRAVVDACLNSFLPADIFRSDTVQDLKGCGPQPLLNNTEASVDQSSPEEELLYIAGLAFLDEDREQAETQTDLDEHFSNGFELQVLTNFEQFVGCNHISHSIRTVRQGRLSPDIGLREMARLSGVAFEHFRIGLEVFHERFTGRMGVAPVGDQRFFLDAEPGRFKLLLGAEHLQHKSDLPLTKDGLFERLNDLFQELFAFDIKTDYLRLIQRPIPRYVPRT